MADRPETIPLDDGINVDAQVTHRSATGDYQGRTLSKWETCRNKVDLSPILYWVIVGGGLFLYYIFSPARPTGWKDPDVVWLLIVLASISIPLRKIPRPGTFAPGDRSTGRWNLPILLIQIVVIMSAFVYVFLLTLSAAWPSEQALVPPSDVRDDDPVKYTAAVVTANALISFLYVSAVLPALSVDKEAHADTASPNPCRKRCRTSILGVFVAVDVVIHAMGIVFFTYAIHTTNPAFPYLVAAIVIHLLHRLSVIISATLLIVKEVGIHYTHGYLPMFRTSIVLIYTAAMLIVLVGRSQLIGSLPNNP